MINPETDPQESEDEKQHYWKETLEGLNKMADKLGLPIDEGAKETVASLIVNGFPTYSSCEGHLEKRSGKTTKLSPYVGVGFDEPEIRFKGEKEIKDKIASEFGVAPEKIEKNDVADKAYWNYISQHNVPETPEYLAVREQNEALQQSMKLILESYYKERKIADKCMLVIEEIGPGGHFKITPKEKKKNGVKEVKEKEIQKARQNLLKEQEEIKTFTQFMKERYFNP